MDEKTKQGLRQLKVWWGADPIATMQQILVAPASFTDIAGTEIGQRLLSPEVGRSIEKILVLHNLIKEM